MNKPTIVLVHGAFADGSGWQHVIPLLQSAGYAVIAVQNPLSSVADDVATTKRVLEAQTGPVIAVGHSYGGVVVSAAAAGNPNVKALVFISAIVPEAGELIGALLEREPSELGANLRPDSGGFLYIDKAKFQDLFCADVSDEEARIMQATQKPIHGSIFAGMISEVAWKTIPSWYMVAKEDRTINPQLERFMAQRAKSKTTEVQSSHVPFISKPGEVVKLIEAAAKATVGLVAVPS